MKLFSLIIFLLPLIDNYVESAVVRSSMLPHNLYECDPTKTRIRILQKIIQKSGRPNTVISDAFQYPRVPEMFSASRAISCIVVEDMSRNGKGGYAEIVAGGIGYNFVTITFESQRGEDIMFSVTLYATYPQILSSAADIGHATPEP